MEITFNLLNGCLSILLVGELDEHTAPLAKRKLQLLLAENAYNRVIFDMARLTFMDSTGIGVMIGCYKLLKARNVTAEIANASPTIGKIFKMSGLYEIFVKQN